MQSAIRYTTAYLDALSESRDGTRYEIIDGELYVSSQSHWEHQDTSTKIASGLDQWSMSTGLGISNIAPGVILSEYESVAPDIVWISFARLREGLRPDGKLHLPPEIVIEILSSGSRNIRRDREAKPKLYDATGVAEYWIVDWRMRTIDVFRRLDAQLSFVETLGDGERLTTPILPGFDKAIEGLWAPRFEM